MKTPLKNAPAHDPRVGKLVVALLLLLALALGLMGYFVAAPSLKRRQKTFFDPRAKTGTLPGLTQEEIDAEQAVTVEEGTFHISIASVVLVDANTQAAELRMENIAANHYHIAVRLVLEGETEPICQSGAVAPGQYLETVQLRRPLPEGVYTATAVFTAYDQDTHKPVGKVTQGVTVVVSS